MGHTPLHRAVSCGNMDIIRPLIRAGADVNMIDVGGNTILHLAANMGDLSMVKLLCNIITKMPNASQVKTAFD